MNTTTALNTLTFAAEPAKMTAAQLRAELEAAGKPVQSGWKKARLVEEVTRLRLAAAQVAVEAELAAKPVKAKLTPEAKAALTADIAGAGSIDQLVGALEAAVEAVEGEPADEAPATAKGMVEAVKQAAKKPATKKAAPAKAATKKAAPAKSDEPKAPAANARKYLVGSPRAVLAAWKDGTFLIANRTPRQTNAAVDLLGATVRTNSTAGWAGEKPVTVLGRMDALLASDELEPGMRATVEALRIEASLARQLIEKAEAEQADAAKS